MSTQIQLHTVEQKNKSKIPAEKYSFNFECFVLVLNKYNFENMKHEQEGTALNKPVNNSCIKVSNYTEMKSENSNTLYLGKLSILW